MWKSIRNIRKAISSIDAKHGEGVGRDILKYTTIASMIFIFICLAVMGIIKYIDKVTVFELDGKNKYIIYNNGASDEKYTYYYEIDLEEDKISERRDSVNQKREKMADIKTDCDKLEEAIKEVIEKDEKIEMSATESTELYNQNIQTRYSIKDYTGNIYYANDKEDILEIRELLD